MLLDISWNAETTQVDLVEGTVRVGGGSTDDIRIEGLPEGLLELRIEAEQVLVTATRSVQIGAALFPARVPRLLGDGEVLQLPNDVVLRRPVNQARQDSRKLVGTAFVARELLAADLAPEQTRAASLTCVTGFDQGRIFPIAFERSVLGRADDADLRVRDRTVSRQHAHLLQRGKGIVLKALSSTNGIFVNGIRVKVERVLQSGDIIELGQTMLRFEGGERAPEEVTKVKPQEAAPSPAPVSEPEAVTASAVTAPLGPPVRRQLPFEVLVMSVGVVMAVIGVVVSFFMLR